MPEQERLDALSARVHAEKARESQVHLQQRTVEALTGLLARITNEGLPVISWSIHSNPAKEALTGTCDAGNTDKRRKDFEVWRQAINAERLPDETNAEGATRLRAEVTDNYLGLSIALTADV
ncbi:hypothetical protein ACFOY2_12025 [Nonomuraea purpurea]|uniref:Uncharacterized protein n=1 Tax=Nonomuraea purpurea TaxID=1849276 RepID=A0ABV8G4A2_9ACTN